MDAIAQKLDVSRRTVERWATDDAEGKWTDLKAARKVVAIGEARAAREEEIPRPRRSRSTGNLDPLELVDTALYDVSGMMGGGDDGREVAALAGALCKLIELKLKLEPPTAAALAERVITLGFTPHEFAAALKEQWRLKA